MPPRTDPEHCIYLSPGTATCDSPHLPLRTAAPPRVPVSSHLSPESSSAPPTNSPHLPLRTAPLRLALVALLTPALASAAPVAPDPVSVTAPAAADPVTSPADGPRAQLRVLVLPRREGDPLPPATDASLRESLRDGLRRAGAALIEAAPLGAGECSDPACLARLRATIGLRYIVRATLSVVDRDYTLHLELLDTRSNAVVAEFNERCALCGLAEARARLADGAAGLLAPLLTKPATPAMLEVRSDPPGAQIDLDGLPAGRAPFERAASPGPHRVRATLPGHQISEREVSLVDGERSTLQITLTPTPTPPPSGRLLLALGVPLAILGVTLLALDDRRIPLGCTGSDCRRELQILWPGAAALTTGAVLTTIGAIRMHRARRRSASTTR